MRSAHTRGRGTHRPDGREDTLCRYIWGWPISIQRRPPICLDDEFVQLSRLLSEGHHEFVQRESFLPQVNVHCMCRVPGVLDHELDEIPLETPTLLSVGRMLSHRRPLVYATCESLS